MEQTVDGRATFHTRVENWQCDFNGHWNTSYYARSFEAAARRALQPAAASAVAPPGLASRHMRFHRELFPGAPVEVRSASIVGGAYEGATVHVLIGDGRVAATALDLPAGRGDLLPRVAADALPNALPRGLTKPPALPWRPDAPGTAVAEVGSVGIAEADGAGTILFDELIRRIAHASHHHIVDLGYSIAFTETTGIGRMLAEMRVTMLGRCPPGTFLQASSRLAAVEGKSFTTSHHLRTVEGAPVALVESLILATDMKTRRATAVPDFLLAHLA